MVVSDLLAVYADGEQALEGLDVVQGMLQLSHLVSQVLLVQLDLLFECKLGQRADHDAVDRGGRQAPLLHIVGDPGLHRIYRQLLAALPGQEYDRALTPPVPDRREDLQPRLLAKEQDRVVW